MADDETWEVSTTKEIKDEDPDTIIFKGGEDWSQRNEINGDKFVINIGEAGEITLRVRIFESLGCYPSDDPMVYYDTKLFYDKRKIPKSVKKILWNVTDGGEEPMMESFPRDMSNHEDCMDRGEEGPTLSDDPEDPGDRLDVNFEIHVEKRKSKESPLHKGLESLLDAACLTDLNLVCQWNKIPCHKAVLAALSPVFRAELSGKGFKESKEGEIVIKDFPLSVVEVAIKFLYTQDIRNIKPCASKLLFFADKYDIKVLHSACEEYLADNINPDNAIEMLKLAMETNAHALKSVAITSIGANWSNLKKDANLKQLLDEYHGLAKDLVFCIP